LIADYHRGARKRTLKLVSGGMGVSPYLLSQLPNGIPKLLLRGVVSNEIVKVMAGNRQEKKNWVVFSGTHEGTQGLEQMIRAWRTLDVPDWELHIAGQGPITEKMEDLARGCRNIVFHGLLNRADNARLICAAKIGMNPQDVTTTPGNVFAFKIVEYLAAGAHVLTTPRGALEPELEKGVTYIGDNRDQSIARGLKELIQHRRYESTAVDAAIRTYGPAAVSDALNRLLAKVCGRKSVVAGVAG
jgi:glycosyltransferase involved in cell wall biosynthesis